MEVEVAEALERTNFALIDAAIVAVYLAGSVTIGFLVRRYVNNMTTYIGAGRKVGLWLGVATMTGTEMGLITLMYSAQKGFTGGFAAFHIGLIAGAVTLLIGLSGFIVVPLRQLKVLTIPEYYERRFDRKTRVLGGIMLAFGGILNMGLFLKVGSMFIVGVTGLSSSGLALPIVMVVLLVLVLIYTTLGGMVSVVLTDYVQFVILSIGLLVATFLAIDQLGWGEISSTVENLKGAAGSNPVAEGSGFGWSYVLWMVVTAGLVSCAVWPTAVARALAMESAKAVKRQYMWSSVSFMVRFIVPMFWGICALVYIQNSADGADLKALFFPPEGSGVEPMDNLYAMPIYMGRLLPPVILGVMTAAMIAAFMSTHDSYFLCWSSVITQDIVAPLRKKPLSDAARVKLTRCLIVAIGAYVLYWGLFYKGKEDIWDYMAVSGAIYFTGALAVLICGLYWKGASSTGAFAALLTGLTALFGLGPVQQLTGLQYRGEDGQWVQRITGAEVGLAAVVLAFAVMIGVSLLFPDKEGPEDSGMKGELA